MLRCWAQGDANIAGGKGMVGECEPRLETKDMSIFRLESQWMSESAQRLELEGASICG